MTNTHESSSEKTGAKMKSVVESVDRKKRNTLAEEHDEQKVKHKLNFFKIIVNSNKSSCKVGEGIPINEGAESDDGLFSKSAS
jgi:hypothetical protein